MMRRRDKCGFVIVAVLVIVMSALLIATSMLYLLQADATIAAHGREAQKERALLVSAIQVIADELERQREECLAGILPELDEQYTMYEREGRAGVVRLMPVGADGSIVVPESTKLDVNLADAEMLAAFEMISEPLAERIVAHRDRTLGRPYQSIAELLDVPGIDAEMLYGPLDEIDYLADARGGDEDGVGERIRTRLLGAEPRGLADVLTVWSVEPALQRSGKLRINLNVEWSDELADRVAERFDADAARLLGQIFETTTFDDESVLYQVLKQFDVEPAEWPDIIDSFTADDGEHHFGRVNINHAPVQVLAALPGLDEETASAIVQARSRLSSEDAETVAWCGIEEILDVDAYIALADWLTTRSWTYRLRLAVGEVDVDDPGADLEHLSIAEVVIDLASPQARIAYLRDVTMFDVASALAAGAGGASSELDADAGPAAANAGNDDRAERNDLAEVSEPAGDDPEDDGEQPDLDQPDMNVDGAAQPVAGDTSKRGTRIGRWIPGQ